MLDEVQNKLKTEYKKTCHSDSPHCYVQLTIVQDEMYHWRNKKLNDISSYTTQGQVDEIVKIKEPLKRGLVDVFHYKNKPCPQLIFILGAPGNKLNVFLCIHYSYLLILFLSFNYFIANFSFTFLKEL